MFNKFSSNVIRQIKINLGILSDIFFYLLRETLFLDNFSNNVFRLKIYTIIIRNLQHISLLKLGYISQQDIISYTSFHRLLLLYIVIVHTNQRTFFHLLRDKFLRYMLTHTLQQKFKSSYQFHKIFHIGFYHLLVYTNLKGIF